MTKEYNIRLTDRDVLNRFHIWKRSTDLKNSTEALNLLLDIALKEAEA